MKVCVVPSDWDGAAHYRCFYPASYLADRGHTCSVPPVKVVDGSTFVFEGIDRTLVEARADVYVFHHPLQAEYAQIAPTLPGRVVVDLDDDFRHLPAYHPAAWMRTRGSEGQPRHGEFLERMLGLADAVSVATPALAESYEEFSPTVLRNRLHWPLWEPVIPVYEQEWRRVRVGWMGGLEWRSADLDVLRGVIGPWLEQHPEVEFVAAGDQRVHDYLGVPAGQRVTTARIPFRNQDLPYTTATMDVGLVPLASNLFNEAKSYLKGMEYAACGIPCIATPTAEYERWVVPGENGFLARNPADWRSALDELVGDAELRRRMGEIARCDARDNSMEGGVGGWEDFYRGLCDNADDPRPGGAARGLQAVGVGADDAGESSGRVGRDVLWAAKAA